MRRAFRLECLKARRKHFWLIALSMTAVQGLWLGWATRSFRAEQLSQGYMVCLYQFPMINTIVMSVLLSVLMSRMCDMEHRGSTLKQLFTMQPAGALFDAKFLLGAAHLAAVTVLQLLTIWLVGRWRGFADAISASQGAYFLLGQLATGLLLLVIMELLCLKFHNQFIPMALGLILAFAGLMSSFFSPMLMRLCPSAYYSLFLTSSYVWNEATHSATYFAVPFSWGDFALLCAVFGALYGFGRRAFIKREV